MAASTGDKITDVRNAARPVTTTVSSGRSAGGVSLACVSLVGWPTASKVHFVTYKIDSNSNPVAGTQLDCQGIVSGSTINSFSVIDGSDTGNSVGDVVEMLPTAAWGQDLADALTHQHSRIGAHVGVNNTGGMTTDTLAVSGASVLTGGTTLPAGDIVSADIAADNVTDDKLVYGKLRTRLGGSATNWGTAGTNTYDYSATNTVFQCGTSSGNSGADVTVTFGTPFGQVPNVVATCSTASTANCYVVIASKSASTFVFRCIDASGVQRSEEIFWQAIGE